MELLRLKALVLGTVKSTRLEEGEQDLFLIPLWISSPEKELTSIDDYVHQLILHTPKETGDLILDAFIESTQVADDMDISPDNPDMRPYLAGESPEDEWTEEQNVFVTVIEGIMTENSISSDSDVGDIASLIYQAVSDTSMFGWSNLESADAIAIIEMIITAMYDEDDE